MAKEIEYKFVVEDIGALSKALENAKEADHEDIVQGYLVVPDGPAPSVAVRYSSEEFFDGRQEGFVHFRNKDFNTPPFELTVSVPFEDIVTMMDWEDNSATIRVRLSKWKSGKEEAFVTLKGKADGISRDEFEYEIPLSIARRMLTELSGNRYIVKTRYFLNFAEQKIEIDIFDGLLDGVILAEIEVASKDQVITKPEWFGKDVSTDIRYSNAWLAINGYPE